MGIFKSNPEAIRPSSFDGFIENLLSEGTHEIIVRGTFKEKFVDVADQFIYLTTGIKLTTPMRAAHMRFYCIGAQFEANSITGLPVLFNEDYEAITRFGSGIVTTNLDDVAAKTFLTIEDRIGRLQSRIPGIKVTLIDDGKQVTQELANAIHDYARTRDLGAYGKPVQLSFRYA
ncbi:hypothetical protein HYV80_01030 [Candidatus Woesearchaeota archaeon]|nr:hypothetical protein [Candidatus Woesearchaeota archaeon]